jgi:hypothetical protein
LLDLSLLYSVTTFFLLKELSQKTCVFLDLVCFVFSDVLIFELILHRICFVSQTSLQMKHLLFRQYSLFHQNFYLYEVFKVHV